MTSTTQGRTRLAAALAALTVAVLGAGCTTPAQASTTTDGVQDAVLFWNEAAGRAATAACIAPFDNPLHESRMYAMTHLAIHDALNAIDRRYDAYASRPPVDPMVSPAAAVVGAASAVLTAAIGQIPAPFTQDCRNAGVASVEYDLAQAMAGLPASPATTRGLDLGRSTAAAVLAARTGDGSDTPLIVSDFPQGSAPGAWRFTPDRPFAFAPKWGEVRPFALRSTGQFRSGTPLALTSQQYAWDLAEVRTYGSDRTPSAQAHVRSSWQTEVALFWWQSSPLAWNAIGRDLARLRGLDGHDTARLFALLNMALADGYVGSFAQKYDDLFWRPVTAIRLADTDGNPDTTADPTWNPLQVTPPIPEHDSAHAVEGGAAAGVLRTVLGTDQVAFSACSVTLPQGKCGELGEIRHQFTSLTQAATENSESRIWIGFHFRHAVEEGQAHGVKIGRWTAEHSLLAVRH
ncbi:MAG TPA: vanadium-dependent haloperoxidase [Lapillicoccus sp.]|nr:vanadium-dependent haloperoxidase [Lapillicoccus sp.]